MSLRFLPWFFFSLFVLWTGQARAGECFPACRKGYVCNAESRCVSECNPPCEAGTACHAGECVMSAAPKESRAAKSSSASDGVSSDAEGESNADHRFTALAGGALFFATESAPGLAAGFRWNTRGNHSLVLGPRFIIGLPEGPDFGVVGVDVGYRGNFAKGNLRAGLVALAVPQFWIGGAASMFHIGVGVGPFVHVNRFYIELPITVGFATWLDDPFQGRARDLGGVVTVNLLAGVTF